ncbi:MAG: CHASE2 domain-containing protein [Elusimicrobiota bacterium]
MATKTASEKAKAMGAADAGDGEGKSAKYAFHKRFTAGFALLLAALNFFFVFSSHDDAWVDTLFRRRGMEEGDPRITVVSIDDTSLEKVGAYPWPRDVYGKLLDNLYASGTKAVGLDILFLDPNDSKRDKSGKLIPGPKDRALIRWTNKAGKKLVHAIALDTRGELYQFNQVWDFDLPFFDELEGVYKNYGLVQQPLSDNDGTVREIPFLVGVNAQVPMRDTWTTDKERVTSFGLKVLAAFEEREPDSYVKEHGRNQIRLNLRGEIPGFQDFEIDDNNKLQPVARPARYGIKRIPAWKILELDKLMSAERELIKKQLDGGLVLVGATAQGAYDHFPTAFSGSTPGVESHATLVDNLLNNRYLREAPRAVSYIMIFALACAAYWLVSLPALTAGLAFVGLLVGWVLATYFAFVNLYVLEFWAPMLSLGVTFGVLMVHKTMLEQQQKKEVRAMFGQYVAPEIVDILVKDRSKLRLGGEKRDMTIFFLDIAHFTSISEKMTPEALINFLNRYLTALTDDILESKGVVDKYIGDCIMAFWNAPLKVHKHREQACLAALGCIKTIQRLNDEYVDPTMPEKPAVRIGLNSGEVVVGNTGSARKLAYTVLGDEVNLSSRLEGANKFFGSVVMCSEDTYEGAKEAVEARRLGSVRVVGKDIPIMVYELLAKKGELSKEWTEALPLYHGAIEKYLKRSFEDAKTDFEKVLKLLPDDKPTKLYHNACKDYLVIPPPAIWDGVFNLTSK